MNDKYFIELINILKDNGSNIINENSDIGRKYVVLYSYSYYFNSEKDSIYELEEGIIDDPLNVDPIEAIYIDERNENTTIDIVSFFNCDSYKIDISKLISHLSSVDVFANKKRNQKLKEIIELNKDKTKEPIKCYKLITNYIPRSFDEKESIIAEISNYFTPTKQNDIISIVFADDLKDTIDMFDDDGECVSNGKLTLDRPNNFLINGPEQSIIVNVMASSLKEAYLKYGRNSLFAANLRFYVKNVKVDSGISKSIISNAENFWHLNNGIIIICDNYNIIDKNIYLTNFSIVNGGQTTRMIGESSFESDFPVVCKVIKNKYDDVLERLDFVNSVAEASNTQKPIKASDLIASRVEQKLFKSSLKKENIFLQIKRGEIVNKTIYKEPWQKIKNDELAQLIYAGIYQMPGGARNSKSSLISVENKYRLIFGTEYNNSFLKDLIYIKMHYKKWARYINNIDLNKIYSDEIKELTRIKKGLVKNGFYFVEGLICLLAKIYFSEKFYIELDNYKISENDISFKSLYQSMTFNHRLFKLQYKELECKIFDLFDYIVTTYMVPKYMSMKEDKPTISYFSYTKSDTPYTEIVKFIISKFKQGYKDKIYSILNDIFYVTTEEESINSDILVSEALSRISIEENSDILQDPTNKKLYDELKKYRLDESKKRKIEAYYIFSNDELENLVRFKPVTETEFYDFSCFIKFKKEKVNTYGSDIINIISKY